MFLYGFIKKPVEMTVSIQIILIHIGAGFGTVVTGSKRKAFYEREEPRHITEGQLQWDIE